MSITSAWFAWVDANLAQVFMSDYSYRSAIMGSTLAAFQAGLSPAPTATAMSTPVAVAMVAGS
jgi:hypothetical protein